ncbi:right-handed parallel beta-helix repeat-containing protein [Candidatus Latescibacterota bacterium]
MICNKRLLTLVLAVMVTLSCGKRIIPGNVSSPEAIKEVANGTREVANAAWWGFDRTDATKALQAAIDSGARKVIVPNMGADWIVRPITLRGDLEVVFEKGVVVTAKKGEFKGTNDCLFRAVQVENLTLKGYGAILRMQKADYMTDAYKKAEWRMVLGLYSCNNVKISGLKLKDSGGDGIYLGVNGKQMYCRDIHIKDVVCDNNHRQGISVISAENLLIEDCTLKNTWGTPPEGGIDLEPNHANEKMKNCIIRNCTIENNNGAGIIVYLRPLSAKSEDVSILFENCRVTSEKGAGIYVGAVKDDGPGGLIEFKKCIIRSVREYGGQVCDKSADRARVRFEECVWKYTAMSEGVLEAPSPLWIYLRRPELTKRYGGVDFVNCTVEDILKRPFLTASEKESNYGVSDIGGTITVINPRGVSLDTGENARDVTLTVKEK